MQLTFPSYEFVFFFLPAALLGYRAIRRIRGRAGSPVAERVFLTACSMLFYLSFGVANFLVLSLQAATGWLFYCLIRRSRSGRAARGLLLCTVVFELLLLGWFKYGAPSLPLALSFTTFALVSFLSDASRGEIGDCGIVDYLLYFFFFPKLLQGPIVRYQDHRAHADRAARTPVPPDRFAQAALYFILGLSKKVLLADRLAPAADLIFRSPGDLLWLEAVLGIVTYSFQLYFDFSGYCDMGRAMAWMFGFDLPRNFDHPYRAANVPELWRRWHMTLTAFLTRYVYIPLGGSRRGQARALCNTLAVFALSGIWHGTGAGYLVWGLAHGLASCAARLLRRPLPLPRFLKVLGTYVFFTLTLIPFRAASLADAGRLLAKIMEKPWLKLHDPFIDAYLDHLLWYPLKVLGVPDVRTGGTICLWLTLGVSAALIFLAPNAEELSERTASRWETSCCAPTAVAAALLFLWCVLSFGSVSSFAYFDF